MRHQDGSLRWAKIEAGLRRAGYALEFACRYGEDQPEDLGWHGRETGWETRRLLKAWCRRHGLTDTVILRNTSYHQDLIGPVYELWVRTPAATAQTGLQNSA